MGSPAIEHRESNVWVIDPTRRNGHRLDAESHTDIFGEPVEPAPDASYRPVAMAEALKAKPVVPDIGWRVDGRCLLYRGKTHLIYGTFETAKSWLALHFAAQVLVAGKRVCYLDYEDSAESIGQRLLALGVPSDILVDPQRFMYVHPERSLADESERQAFDDLLSQELDLAVVDGVTEAMSLEGLDGNPGKDIAAWQHMCPNAIARRTGAATVCIDHLPKDKSNQAMAIGGQHKMSGLSGAAYVLDLKDPFGKGLVGRSMVRVRKDRPGGVRGLLGTDYRVSDRTHLVAELVMDARDPDRLNVRLYEPHVRVLGSDRPTWCMEKASRYIESVADPSLRSVRKTTEHLWANVTGDSGETVARDLWRKALDCLVDDEFMKQVDGPRKSKVYQSLRPYRQDSDPQASTYDENAPTPEELDVIANRERVRQLEHEKEMALEELQGIEQELKGKG